MRKPARGTTPTSGNARTSGNDRNDASDNPAAPPSAFPPLSLLSAEELLAEQPSIDMLRRVRRGLRALPESDQRRHPSE
ncbi:hypothetical protein [Streptomyces tailanensis]|uniref:hypothetical protein n=1 Tax=Streptomyces tailanensis TaxID=2569858 RepID=UPI00122EA47D|nr:hypothetical protein [Streptomyces tailanensis]